jgi:alpha-beta hydrolase superfamily lysophospholipase
MTSSPLIESQRLVNSLKKMGHKNIEFTIYPKAKHDSWKEPTPTRSFTSGC